MFNVLYLTFDPEIVPFEIYDPTPLIMKLLPAIQEVSQVLPKLLIGLG